MGSAEKILRTVPGIHPKTAALLAYIMGEVCTTPHITAHAVTSDGYLMVGTSVDPMLNELFERVTFCRDKVADLVRHCLQQQVITLAEAATINRRIATL